MRFYFQDGLFFKIFGKVNEKTQVPTAGIILTGVLCAALAALVQLEALANLISLGVLQVFTFVDVGVIIMRMRPTIDRQTTVSLTGDEASRDDFHQPAIPNVTVDASEESVWELLVSICRRFKGTSVSENGSKPVAACVIFTMSVVVLSMAHSKHWGVLVVCVCMLLALVSAALLMVLPRSTPPDTFQCPCVPLIPLLGVACNGYMMGSLPLSSWIFSAIWLVAGVVIYFFYGMKNSALRQYDNETLSEESPLLLRETDHARRAPDRSISLPLVHPHSK